MNTYVALKVTTAKSSTTEHESNILEHLSREDIQHPGKKHVMTLLDSFEHQGPNGLHRCLAFDVMGPSTSTMFENLPPKLRTLLSEPGEPVIGNDLHRDADKRGRYPLWMAKSILRQTLLGIDFLHKNGISHGDLQPGNILFSVKDLSSLHEGQLAQVDKQGYDFVRTEDSDGTVHFHPAQFTDPSTTFEGNRLPEAQAKSEVGRDVDRKPDPSFPRYIAMKQPLFDYVDLEPPLLMKISDFGGAFFDSQSPAKPVTPLGLRSPELILGEPITRAQDIWSFGCLMFEFITGRMMFSVMAPLPGMDEEKHLILIGEEEDDREEIDPTTVGEEKDDEAQWDGDIEDEEQRNDGISHEHDLQHEGDIDSEGYEYVGGTDDSTDDDHVLQMAATLGPLPTEFLARYPRSSIYFNEKGETTRHYIGNLGQGQTPDDIETLPPLEAFLDREKGADLGEGEAFIIKELLRTILQFDATKRPSASEILTHPWFADSVVSAAEATIICNAISDTEERRNSS
jgi:serine/threonine protein kinase